MSSATPWFRLAAFLAILVLALPVPCAKACDTPVYRYAMYRWEPAPYEVFLFHKQPLGDQEQKVVKLLTDYGQNRESPANVFQFSVDLEKDKDLKTVPPLVKKAFLAHSNPELPVWIVFTPFGVEVFFGKLDEAGARALVESPTRTQLAEQLSAGKAGVFLVVPGASAADNEKAETAIQGVLQDVAQGKVELYIAPSAQPSPGAGEQKPAAPTLELGWLKLDRKDVREDWLVKSLLAMEPELAQETKPMAFLIYGRGRALPPFIGDGVSRENLVYAIEFITGACSCTVKEQNPGVDLLVRNDWEKAAMTLAQKFSGEEGGPGMFYPELIIPSGAAPATAAPTAGKDDVTPPTVAATQAAKPAGKADAPAPAATAAGQAAAVATAAADKKSPSPPAAEKPAPAKPGSDPQNVPAKNVVAPQLDKQNVADPPHSGEAPKTKGTPTTDAPPKQVPPHADLEKPSTHTSGIVSLPAESSSSQLSVFVVGGGVLAGLLVLFVLTFFVLRPQ